ncbi:MAG: hypothetical protein RJA70_4446 [Pseudomonadota bacterium]|jgi:hypothetical protein
MHCGSCGAQVSAQHLNCPYCGVMTPLGQQQQYYQQHHQAHLETLERHQELQDEARRLADARASVTRTANFSLYWGVGGLLGCFCLVPSLIALVLGLRARKLSKKYALVLPLNATLGPVLGLIGLLFGTLVIGIAVHAERTRAAQIAALEARLGDLSQTKLQHATACDLAQRRLLTEGFAGSTNIEDFECDGKLLQDGTSATLEAIRLKTGSDHHTVRACLEYGARWSVSGFRKQALCSQPDDTTPGQASRAATGTAGPGPSSAGQAPN